LSEGHAAPGVSSPPRTVFFLSDYGTQDEFVGVVHAVLTAGAPGVRVIDLAHQIAAFDIRSGAFTLSRAVPYLGPGVVLAVVDPGVGSGRRGVCLEVAPTGPGPRFFVGPDNGLLVDGAELAGAAPIARAIELASPPVTSGSAGTRSVTFDGRDLFAPAAAALARGVPLEELGQSIDAASLHRLAPPLVEHAQLGNGRRTLRADVVWVDRFGNIELAATDAVAREAGLPGPGPGPGALDLTVGKGHPGALRRVETFADLDRGELGLLVDASGHLAVVAGQASAAETLAVKAGESVTLTW
jgi:S-adenosylmethionine hydrolase